MTDDLDEGMLTTQNITVIYNPSDDGTDQEHYQMLDSIANELQSSTRAHIQDQFSQSTSDSVFNGMSDGKQSRTRDCLTQMIEGACLDCDTIGVKGVNEFDQHLMELHAFCNEKNIRNPMLQHAKIE